MFALFPLSFFPLVFDTKSYLKVKALQCSICGQLACLLFGRSPERLCRDCWKGCSPGSVWVLPPCMLGHMVMNHQVLWNSVNLWIVGGMSGGLHCARVIKRALFHHVGLRMVFPSWYGRLPWHFFQTSNLLQSDDCHQTLPSVCLGLKKPSREKARLFQGNLNKSNCTQKSNLG